MKKAVIAGASGLIGSELLQILLKDETVDQVLVVVRKELAIRHHKLSQLPIDFDKMDRFDITGDVFFCCLGSTQKKTPDKALYYKIDHDYPLQFARIAAKNPAAQFHLVSAISANTSATNFYSKMKGETARDVSVLDFQLLNVYEPSLLIGRKNENRPGEKFFAVILELINPLFFGSWKKYRSISGANVAAAMYAQALLGEPGKYLIQFAWPDLIKQPLAVP